VYFVETGVGGLDTFGSLTTVAGVVLAVLRGLLAGADARGLEADSCLASGVEASCVSDFCAVSTFSDSLVTGGVFWHPMPIINRPQTLTVFNNLFIASVLLDFSGIPKALIAIAMPRLPIHGGGLPRSAT
jgi:hypothetical protein